MVSHHIKSPSIQAYHVHMHCITQSILDHSHRRPAWLACVLFPIVRPLTFCPLLPLTPSFSAMAGHSQGGMLGLVLSAAFCDYAAKLCSLTTLASGFFNQDSYVAPRYIHISYH